MFDDLIDKLSDSDIEQLSYEWELWALLASIGASFGLRGFSAFAQKAKKI